MRINLFDCVNNYYDLSFAGVNKHGEKIYNAMCKKCGFIYYGCRLADLKNKIDNSNSCKHNLPKELFLSYNLYNKFTVVKIVNSNGPNTIYRFRCNKCNFMIDNTAYNMVKLINRGMYDCKCHTNIYPRRYTYGAGYIIGGQYKIIEETCPNKYNQMKYSVQCLKCGYIYKDVLITDIRRKVKAKKGCNHAPQKASYNTWKVKRIGHIYGNMIRRCHDPRSINYKDYGGSGIRVCDEWLNDHTAFENWMLDNGYQDTWEIDRIDHTKGYCPENCRLVPPGYNSKFNRSNTPNYIINGELVTGPDIARRLGLPKYYFTNMRRKHGKEYTQKTMEGMLDGTIPLPDKNSCIEFNGKEYNMAELARLLELDYMPLYHKHYAWPEKKFRFYIKQRYKEIQFNKEKKEYLNRKAKSCIDSD